MKPKATRGRKRFSAGKQLGPERDWPDNVVLASIGEVVTDPVERSAFELVASWPDYRLLLTGQPPNKRLAAARWHERRMRVIKRLVDILDPVFLTLDTGPIERFKRSIETLARGAVSPLERGLLVAAMQAGIISEDGSGKMEHSALLTRLEFKDRFGIHPTDRHIRRLCVKLGIPFKPGKPGRPRNP
jgi:hypothetical protein